MEHDTHIVKLGQSQVEDTVGSLFCEILYSVASDIVQVLEVYHVSIFTQIEAHAHLPPLPTRLHRQALGSQIFFF